MSAIATGAPTRLWEPFKLGRLELKNRLVMAPMTRDRATPSGTPTELNARYYAQRASFGLQITEGTQPSADGQGYLLTPGVYTDEHVSGWKQVADAVHAAGGHLYLQLMHVGRASHPDNTPHHRQALAPSAVKPAAKMFTAKGMLDIPEPRALTTAEIAQTIADFRHAARTAIAAGADGVELHGANGYLIQQFLAENTNQRSDEYGGSVAHRTRFGVEVAAAVAEEIGADRTAIRLSPGSKTLDIAEEDTTAIYQALVPQLARRSRRTSTPGSPTWPASPPSRSPIPISSRACRRTRRSTRPTRPPSSAAASTGTPTTRRSPRDGQGVMTPSMCSARPAGEMDALPVAVNVTSAPWQSARSHEVEVV